MICGRVEENEFRSSYQSASGSSPLTVLTQQRIKWLASLLHEAMLTWWLEPSLSTFPGNQCSVSLRAKIVAPRTMTPMAAATSLRPKKAKGC
jgi:hypothetical protein